MISVIIPTFRRQSKLRELLSSLERQVVKVPFEVIVVANLPEVGLKKVVESYGPQFRFHETGRIGVNIARNKGRSVARGQILLFLDDDVYLGDREMLQRHYDLHIVHPEACALGGGFSPRAELSAVETAYHWIREHEFTAGLGERGEARWLFAGNVSFKASSLGSLKFDDRMWFGADSLFARLRFEQNLLVFEPSLTVEHRLSCSLFDIAKKAFFQGYARGLVAQFNETPLDRPHWNSSLPLDETFRRAHIEPSTLFSLAVTLYRRFFSYGEKVGAADIGLYTASLTSKKIIWRRPELSPARLVKAFFGGFSARSHAGSVLEAQLNAARGAFAIDTKSYQSTH